MCFSILDTSVHYKDHMIRGYKDFNLTLTLTDEGRVKYELSSPIREYVYLSGYCDDDEVLLKDLSITTQVAKPVRLSPISDGSGAKSIYEGYHFYTKINAPAILGISELVNELLVDKETWTRITLVVFAMEDVYIDMVQEAGVASKIESHLQIAWPTILDEDVDYVLYLEYVLCEVQKEVERRLPNVKHK